MKSILLADDNDDDLVLTKMACERSNIPHRLKTVRDGQEALDYLAGEGMFKNREEHPLPSLFLLDIKMPKLDGHEVLKWIREHPELKNLPVVMLTTSDAKSDLDRAYTLGVNSYLTKGSDLTEFSHGIRILLRYWLTLNLGLDKPDAPLQ